MLCGRAHDEAGNSDDCDAEREHVFEKRLWGTVEWVVEDEVGPEDTVRR